MESIGSRINTKCNSIVVPSSHISLAYFQLNAFHFVSFDFLHDYHMIIRALIYFTGCRRSTTMYHIVLYQTTSRVLYSYKIRFFVVEKILVVMTSMLRFIDANKLRPLRSKPQATYTYFA